MLTTAVADEVLRYLYFASLRPLATLTVITALFALAVVLGAVAWEGHRSRPRRGGQVPSRLGRSHVAILLVGALSLPQPPLLP